MQTLVRNDPVLMTSAPKPLRSQPARDRILNAARRVFAAEGYERSTIRTIATAADINPSMVIRYYGNKDGLFAAVASLDFEAPKLAGVRADRLGSEIVRHVLDRWDDPLTGPTLAALLRASISHEAARARVVSMFEEELAKLFESLQPPAGVSDAAPLIATQILGLVTARYILKLPEVANLPKSALIDEVGASIQGYLDRRRAVAGAGR
jgi:AcrR family transcriptional regulator